MDRVYLQLDRSAAAAKALAREGHGRGRLGHEGGLVERDAMVFQAARRIAQLDAAHEGLVFGRLDLREELDPEPRYVGRIGLRDDNRDSHPDRLARPRGRCLLPGRPPPSRTTSYAGACCAARGATSSASRTSCSTPRSTTDLPIVGEGALMAQLSRARDRSMHSIVATIQAEQDRAIRAPGKGVVAISGGPGTGKTVVALHRAAYLLYTDRRRYERGGVLIVGPSGVFMRYIERVLPSLGETAVALRSLGEVVDGVRATRHDEPAVADVKGSARMAELLRRTARQQAPGSPAEFRVFYRDDVLHARPRAARPAAPPADVTGTSQPTAPAHRQHPARRHVAPGQGRARARPGPRRVQRRDAVAPGVRRLRHSWWPPLDAPEVLSWLRDPDFLARIAEGVVSAEDQRLLAKSWSGDGSLSVEDVPLLDELRYALGDIPARHEDDHQLDEFVGADLQELTTAADREYARPAAPGRRRRTGSRTTRSPTCSSTRRRTSRPMQWRMVGRRGRGASWTIVGDPAQSSWPVREEAAAARAEALEGKELHEFHLSTNYRNSSEIYAHAAAYAQRVGLDADLPTAVRSTGIEPTVVADVDRRGSSDREAVAAIAGSVEGTVGIVVPVARRSEVNAWLASWPEFADAAPGAARAAADSSTPPSGEDRIVVLTGLDTKGLEFDGIVVVRPQEIEDESATGRSTLYVVLTRATQLLVTVTAAEPPDVGGRVLGPGGRTLRRPGPPPIRPADRASHLGSGAPPELGTARFPPRALDERWVTAEHLRAASVRIPTCFPVALPSTKCPASAAASARWPSRSASRDGAARLTRWYRSGHGLASRHDRSARTAIAAIQGHEAWAIIRRSTRAG